MGKPADRLPGVRLITDYGALEWALEMKRKQEEEKKDKEN